MILESKFDLEKNRGEIIRANEFIVEVLGKDKFHYKGGKGKFWKRAEMYSSNNWDEPEWTKFEKSSSTDLNGAEVVEILQDKGYEVSDVRVIK